MKNDRHNFISVDSWFDLIAVQREGGWGGWGEWGAGRLRERERRGDLWSGKTGLKHEIVSHREELNWL